MDPEVALHIGAIAEDYVSGATALASKAAEVFVMVAEVSRAPGDAQFLADLAEAGHVLLAAQPSMAPFFHLTNAILQAVERAPREAKRATVQATAKGFAASLARRSARMAEAMLALLPQDAVILTHSASGAVETALHRAQTAGRVSQVYCTESRPMNEGVALVERLASVGIPVTLIADSFAPSLVKRVDGVLLGADTVYPGGVINKAGSYGVALAAQAAQVPVYVLAGSEKFLPSALVDETAMLGEERPAAHLLPTPLPGVKTLNLQFDLTPLTMISSIITERGVQGSDDVRRSCEELTIHRLLQV